MRCTTLLVLPLLVGSAGCGMVCTEEERASIVVTVVDDSGAPYTPDQVTFTVFDTGELPCELWQNEYVCGREQQGSYVVRVYDDGSLVAEEDVEVRTTLDRCHVDTEHLEIVL